MDNIPFPQRLAIFRSFCNRKCLAWLEHSSALQAFSSASSQTQSIASAQQISAATLSNLPSENDTERIRMFLSGLPVNVCGAVSSPKCVSSPLKCRLRCNSPLVLQECFSGSNLCSTDRVNTSIVFQHRQKPQGSSCHNTSQITVTYDEILRLVLPMLDRGSLLACMQVCKRWKDAMKNHPNPNHLTVNIVCSRSLSTVSTAAVPPVDGTPKRRRSSKTMQLLSQRRRFFESGDYEFDPGKMRTALILH